MFSLLLAENIYATIKFIFTYFKKVFSCQFNIIYYFYLNLTNFYANYINIDFSRNKKWIKIHPKNKKINSKKISKMNRIKINKSKIRVRVNKIQINLKKQNKILRKNQVNKNKKIYN